MPAVLGLAVALLIVPIVSAQAAASEAQTTRSEDLMLEEVIVSASRREENLRQVPMSVTWWM